METSLWRLIISLVVLSFASAVLSKAINNDNEDKVEKTLEAKLKKFEKRDEEMAAHGIASLLEQYKNNEVKPKNIVLNMKDLKKKVNKRIGRIIRKNPERKKQIKKIQKKMKEAAKNASAGFKKRVDAALGHIYDKVQRRAHFHGDKGKSNLQIFHEENVENYGPVRDNEPMQHGNDKSGGVTAGKHVHDELDYCEGRGQEISFEDNVQGVTLKSKMKRKCIATKIHCHLHHCQKMENFTDECIVYLRAAYVLCFYRDYCKKDNMTDCIVSHAFDELNSGHLFLKRRDEGKALGGFSSFVHHLEADKRPSYLIKHKIRINRLRTLLTSVERALKQKECQKEGVQCASPDPEPINFMNLPECFTNYRKETMAMLGNKIEQLQTCHDLKKR